MHFHVFSSGDIEEVCISMVKLGLFHFFPLEISFYDLFYIYFLCFCLVITAPVERMC